MDEIKYEQLLNKIKKSEKKSIANIIKYSLISILGALIFITFTILEYTSIRAKTSKIKVQLIETQKSLQDVQKSLINEQKKLSDTFELVKYAFEVKPSDEKYIFDNHQRVYKLWKLLCKFKKQEDLMYTGGVSNEDSFNSSDFVSLILNELKVNIEIEAETENPVEHILKNMKPVDKPRVGDLVIYKNEYVMFYFTNEDNQEFVIGMTPSGIVALKYSFAPVIAHREVEL